MAETSQLDALQKSYDETPYHDQQYPLFDLDRLLGHAQLFGLADPDRTASGMRVLDLGCASGLHLREQARRYPDCHFTGIDFAAAEVELGLKSITEEGLENVELIAADLREAEVGAGQYDIVVCHGVFSWVPDDVKERILLLSRQALAPGGLAAIAYLTYPGWKQREALRELVAMRDRPGQPPRERLRESATLLRFLHAGYRSRPDDPAAAGLMAVVEGMQETSGNCFLHDELGQIHDPCYFLQFAEWALECGLQYLSEADLGTMSTEGLDPSAAVLLDQLAPNALEMQQLVDFVVNRSGRSSLLVRSDATPDRSIQTQVLERLHYGTQWWNVTPLNAPEGQRARFESPTGRRLETDEGCVRDLVAQLAAHREEAQSFEALALEASRNGHSNEDFRQCLSGLLTKGVIEARPAPHPAD
jgi:SAM-dependent methyltransferase